MSTRVTTVRVASVSDDISARLQALRALRASRTHLANSHERSQKRHEDLDSFRKLEAKLRPVNIEKLLSDHDTSTTYSEEKVAQTVAADLGSARKHSVSSTPLPSVPESSPRPLAESPGVTSVDAKTRPAAASTVTGPKKKMMEQDAIPEPIRADLQPRFAALRKFHGPWLALLTLFLAYNSIIVPIRVAFGYSSADKPFGFFCWLDWITDLCVVADIVVNLLAPVDSETQDQDKAPLINREYLFSWLIVVDVLGIVPFDFMQLTYGWKPVVRLPKLIRLLRMPGYMSSIERWPFLATRVLALRISKLLINLYFVGHFVGCLFFLVVRYEGFGTNGWTPTDHLAHENMGSQYLHSVFWVFNVLSGEQGVPTPVTKLEYCFQLVLMSFGVFGMAYLISNVHIAVELATERSRVFRRQAQDVKRFVHQNKVSQPLRLRLLNYYSYLWSRERGFDMAKILRELPKPLRNDIKALLTENVVRKIPMFDGVPAGFLSEVMSRLAPVIAIPGEYVVRIGDPGFELFLIHRGELQVMVGDGASEKEVAVLRHGEYFGEHCLLVPHTVRSASVRATSHCDLLKLSKADFDTALHFYPEAKQKILEFSQNKLRREQVQLENLKQLRRPPKHASQNGATSIRAHMRNKLAKIIDLSNQADDGVIPQWTVAPHSSFRKYWELTMMLVIIYQVLLVPFSLAFMYNSRNLIVDSFNAICDFLYAGDVALRFRMAFIDKRGNVVTDLQRISFGYLRERFTLHTVSLLPIDWILLFLGRTGTAGRVPRILRIYDIVFPTQSAHTVSVHYSLQALLKLMLYFFLLAHWIACAYWSFTFHEGYGTNEWLPPLRMKYESAYFQYIHAQYVAFTHLSSFGEVAEPVTTIEVFFSIWIILCGVFLVAYIIGNVGILMSNLNEAAHTFHTKMINIQSFMQYKKLPLHIQQRARKYHDYLWDCHQGIDPNKVLENLPKGLRDAILVEMCSDMVRAVPLFKRMSENFINSIVCKLKFSYYPSGELIMNAGEIGKDMYFITKGLVEILFDPNISYKITRVLGPGNFFGEMALFSGRLRTASARARTPCHLLRLDRSDFAVILGHYPAARLLLQRVYDRRLASIFQFTARPSIAGPA